MDLFDRRRLLRLLGAGILTPAVTSAAGPDSKRLASQSVPDLDAWLRAHPRIARAIVWQFEPGSPTSAPNVAQWPEPRRVELRAAFATAWAEGPTGLTDPPPNTRQLGDGDGVATALQEAHAWPLYLAHVANSLAIEIGRRVPWSVTDYQDDWLPVLFDGRRMFTRSRERPDEYALAEDEWVVPAPPDVTLAFLRRSDLIAQDRLSTIVRFVDWSRRLTHFIRGMTAANAADHWQYRGHPPASRIMNGTSYTGDVQPLRSRGLTRFTMGCWGTTGFFRSTLRTINIPVSFARISNFGQDRKNTHATPLFPSERKALSHGDDPYNAFLRLKPSFPAEMMLIDQATFNAWFGPNRADDAKNVGRRPAELAIRFLPIYLLNEYAQDVSERKARLDGHVFALFKDYYTLADLERMQLWERLDSKVTEFGGLERIRALWTESVRNWQAESKP